MVYKCKTGSKSLHAIEQREMIRDDLLDHLVTCPPVVLYARDVRSNIVVAKIACKASISRVERSGLSARAKDLIKQKIRDLRAVMSKKDPIMTPVMWHGEHATAITAGGKEIFFKKGIPEPVVAGNFMGWYEKEHQTKLGITKRQWDGMEHGERASAEARLQSIMWVDKEFDELWLDMYAPERANGMIPKLQGLPEWDRYNPGKSKPYNDIIHDEFNAVNADPATRCSPPP